MHQLTSPELGKSPLLPFSNWYVKLKSCCCAGERKMVHPSLTTINPLSPKLMAWRPCIEKAHWIQFYRETKNIIASAWKKGQDISLTNINDLNNSINDLNNENRDKFEEQWFLQTRKSHWYTFTWQYKQTLPKI